MTEIEVKTWKYTRPPWVPEGLSNFIHPCGCKDYEENGVWYAQQCPKHKAETDRLIEKVRAQLKKKGKIKCLH